MLHYRLVNVPEFSKACSALEISGIIYTMDKNDVPKHWTHSVYIMFIWGLRYGCLNNTEFRCSFDVDYANNNNDM